jgi:hypothetical protein
LRNSKDYNNRNKNFDRINTRYNYQNPNGILSYIEQEKQLKSNQRDNSNGRVDWTKQAVTITNQLIKDNNSKAGSRSNHRKMATPSRLQKQKKAI